MTCGCLSSLLFGSSDNAKTESTNNQSLPPEAAAAIAAAVSTHPPKKTKNNMVAVADDKSTVLVWDGILETRNARDDDGEGGYDVHWRGVVVANVNAPDATKVPEPPRNAFKEFVDSDLQFHVQGVAKPVDGGNPKDDDNKFKEHVVSLTSGEGWDDYEGGGGGSSNTKVVDARHDLHVTSLLWRGSPDQRHSIVVATGRTDTRGPFVSVGWMRPGNRVTLARRYLREDDPRASWSPEVLRRCVLAQIYDETDDTIVMPPWKCHALGA